MRDIIPHHDNLSPERRIDEMLFPGYDYHPSENNPCRDSRDDGLHYDANHPKAVYYLGQQVVLAHPMKV